VIGLLIGAVICFSAFKVIGSTVDVNGVLQEPFYLMGLFGLFLFFSIILGFANILARIIRARRKTA